MRYGMRKPSWKKSLSARTKGKRKKTIKTNIFRKNFPKNLVESKNSCTFAPAYENQAIVIRPKLERW